MVILTSKPVASGQFIKNFSEEALLGVVAVNDSEDNKKLVCPNKCSGTSLDRPPREQRKLTVVKKRLLMGR